MHRVPPIARLPTRDDTIAGASSRKSGELSRHTLFEWSLSQGLGLDTPAVIVETQTY